MPKVSEWHIVKESDRERIRCQGIYAGDTCGEEAFACEHTAGGSFFYYCAEHAHKRGYRRFACPKCGNTDSLDVVVTASARLKQYGPEDVQTDLDESMDGSHEWDGDSMMHCTDCGHSDKCSTFDREWEPEAPKPEPQPDPRAEDPRAEAFRQGAKREYEREGEIEIDDGAVVSFGDDPGAYVQAWVWVANSEAGIEPIRCTACGTQGEHVEVQRMVTGHADLVCCEMVLERNLEANAAPEVYICPKCGTPHTSTDHEDEGEGDEAGRTFWYCSEACKEAH